MTCGGLKRNQNTIREILNKTIRNNLSLGQFTTAEYSSEQMNSRTFQNNLERRRNEAAPQVVHERSSVLSLIDTLPSVEFGAALPVAFGPERSAKVLFTAQEQDAAFSPPPSALNGRRRYVSGQLAK